ncbi:twin-arginine translocase TatA/TatE family subunit [Corynebacterium terpenotabidum]|uniref:Sec-independent protein translocase protein TatA n=1 Tax=Corynebacterium terpenotabidum Y-11 TaxID=1200352 RepID=S4XKW3_9CORY|nr:twin-arginine translocase TatA/TatE family subunit [Corynebacterium terpenotabidum]AGP31233.1 Sec-independent protein translocase protein [Corynebacterium terpenotabidum Y-11]
MFANLTGMHAVVILAIVFLLFGAAKLPGLAKSVGQSVRILKKEVDGNGDDAATTAAVTADPVVTALATPVATQVTAPVTVPVTTPVAAQQEQRIS